MGQGDSSQSLEWLISVRLFEVDSQGTILEEKMVECNKSSRNSLQTRLERSRRFRSRRGNHHDAVSVGDESATSMDNASITSASIDPSIQSKNEDSIKRESAKEEPTDPSPGDTPNLANSGSDLSQDKHFSRRQRLTQRSLKNMRTGLPQSPPPKTEAPATVNSPEIKKIFLPCV